MTDQIGNYRKDIVIDETDLAKEWLEQPSLFLYYAEAHADAIDLRDKKKADMEYAYAREYAKIKDNWQEYFDSKPTEAAIKEFILNSEDYQAAEKSYLNANRDVNVLLAAKTAFEHRKRALENLVSLKISGFHSEPRNKKRTLEGGNRQAQKNSLNNKGNRAKSRKTTTRKRRRK